MSHGFPPSREWRAEREEEWAPLSRGWGIGEGKVPSPQPSPGTGEGEDGEG